MEKLFAQLKLPDKFVNSLKKFLKKSGKSVNYPKSWDNIPFKFTKFDYEFLTGNWEGPKGAAFNVTGEDCYEAGLGTYGKPTEKGQKAIARYVLSDQFEKPQSLDSLVQDVDFHGSW